MEKSENQKAEAPSTGAVMGRALVSATVFGALGAWLGSWLGRRGGASENAVAKPMMKWSMGAFWALVAAYSSLKASEQERKAATQGQENVQPSRVDLAVATDSDTKIPASAVDASSVASDGKAAEMAGVSRA